MAYNSRKTNPYGPERNSLGGSGDGTGYRKASDPEKRYYKAAKRDIKGKKSKDPEMQKRISLGVGPSGDYSKAASTSQSKSGYEQMKGLQSGKKSFLTETKQGQKLSSMEQKQMQKSGSKSHPRFQVSSTKMSPYDPSQATKSKGITEPYGVKKHKKTVGKFKKQGIKGY